MFYFNLDDQKSSEHGIVVTKRPDFPAPEMKTLDYEVEGRDGDLIEFLETFDDIEVTVEMNYVDHADWHGAWRKVKAFLLQPKIRNLSFSDDPDYFYKCKKIKLNTAEREFKETANFSAVFLLDPFAYLVDGTNDHTISECLSNPYYLCKPIYTITGEGLCTLTVNGKDFEVNVGQKVTVDTTRKLCYKDNTNISFDGDFEDLFLNNGTNTISISEGFSLSIVPNWRQV